MSKLTCKLCNREFKSYKGITSHIRQTHKINPKEYYDIYVKQKNEEYCNDPKCFNLCGYHNFNYGYYNYCSQRCKNRSPEMRKIVSYNAKKYMENPNNKEKRRISTIKQWRENKSFIKKMTTPNNEFRKRIRDKNIERYKDPIEREKTSQSIKQAYINKPELRKQASERSLRRWNDPEGPFSKQSYWDNLSAALCKTGMNKCETIVFKLIEDLYPEQYKYTGDFNFWIGRKNPDFLCLRKKKVIEHFGIWWHGTKITGKSKEDHEKERIEYFKKYGYNCLIIWEDEIKSGKSLYNIKNNLNDVKNKIITFHEVNLL